MPDDSTLRNAFQRLVISIMKEADRRAFRTFVTKKTPTIDLGRALMETIGLEITEKPASDERILPEDFVLTRFYSASEDEHAFFSDRVLVIKRRLAASLNTTTRPTDHCYLDFKLDGRDVQVQFCDWVTEWGFSAIAGETTDIDFEVKPEAKGRFLRAWDCGEARDLEKRFGPQA